MGTEPRSRGLRPLDLVDVFVYVLVLNLADQFIPAVITETFLISVLTAILFKVVLEVVVVLKSRVFDRIRGAKRPIGRVLGIALLFVVLAGSKFVVLLLVDLIFGDAVSLGGFWPVTGLILVMMAARAGVRIAFEGAKWDGAG